MLGNKCDLQDLRQVHHAEAKQMAKMYRANFAETSAKEGVSEILDILSQFSCRIMDNPTLGPQTLAIQTPASTPTSEQQQLLGKTMTTTPQQIDAKNQQQLTKKLPSSTTKMDPNNNIDKQHHKHSKLKSHCCFIS